MAERIDRKRGWESLGTVAGTFTLFGLRHRLRERNLYDRHAPDPPDPDGFPGRPTVRTVDGTKNDLAEPAMGAVGAQFGRNGPSVPRMDGPAPSLVSEELLARRSFQPATTLNLLAAAWLQFEVHDWMQHREKRDAPLDTDPRPFEQADGLDPGVLALRERSDPLVGRIAALRRELDVRRAAARGTTDRQDQGRARAAAGGRGVHACPTRSRAEPVDRARAVQRPVRSRAQRDLRPARGGRARPRGRCPVRQGASDQRGRHGEDPHRRMDAGDHRPPDDRAQHPVHLVGRPGRARRTAAAGASARARS